MERWDEKAGGAWPMFQGVVSETSLEGLVLGLRPAILPGVTALADGRHWWSLLGVLRCRIQIREQRFVRKGGILRTKKSTSGLYVFVLELSYFLFFSTLSVDWLPCTMLAAELLWLAS